LLDVGQEGRDCGISFAGLFGRGGYEFRDGKLLSKGPLPPEAAKKFFFSDYGGPRLVVNRPPL